MLEGEKIATDHIPKQADSGSTDKPADQKRSTPPESVFVKLGPSRERYSIKLDGDL